MVSTSAKAGEVARIFSHYTERQETSSDLAFHALKNARLFVATAPIKHHKEGGGDRLFPNDPLVFESNGDTIQVIVNAFDYAYCSDCAPEISIIPLNSTENRVRRMDMIRECNAAGHNNVLK